MTEAISVSQLNEYIKMKIDSDAFLSRVTVKGEISNFVNHYKTGHFYMSLKDEGGVIRAIMFNSSTRNLKFVPENGMKVICVGRVSSYVKDGQYQLYISDMLPDGIGALSVAFEQLKKKLEAEGIFDAAHKKPLPKYPLRVGIITSPTGAAVRDMINVSKRRFSLAELILFPCLVQGDGAPAQLCRGVRFFNESCKVDVIIIGRGGGSLEELWAFNDEALAREIYRSEVPIISAVGHETDFSISDFAADLRAPTPSAAAELALPETGDIKRKLMNVAERITSSELNKIGILSEKLKSLASSRALTNLNAQIDDRRGEVLNLSDALEMKLKAVINDKKAIFMRESARLDALSPIAVMTRGYSAVFSESGKTLNSKKDVKIGQNINIRLVDGSINAEVKEVK